MKYCDSAIEQREKNLQRNTIDGTFESRSKKRRVQNKFVIKKQHFDVRFRLCFETKKIRLKSRC